MATVAGLITSISEVIRDPGLAEISSAQITVFINDAAQDASGQGWLIWLADDTSLTFGVGVYTYSVPASFAYSAKAFLSSDKFKFLANTSL